MRIGVSFHVLVATLLGCFSATTPAQSAHYELVNLGTLGGDTSNGHGINNLGQVTGRSRTAAGYFHAFIWSESTGLVDLGTLGGLESEGWGINDHGQVVGESKISPSSNLLHAFRWDGTTMNDAHPAGSWSGAWAINNDGLLVGWNDGSWGTRGFVSNADGLINHGTTNNEFYDINNPAPGAEALAGGYEYSFNLGAWVPISYNTATQARAYVEAPGYARGINRDGTLVGYQGVLPFYAKADSGYAIVVAPMIAGYTGGRFYKINDHGVMAGINGAAGVPNIGVIYTEGGNPVDVNTLLDPIAASGWHVDTLRDISENGYLTGTGIIDGVDRAVLLKPVDADGDGLDYYQEAYVHGTDAVLADSDGDLLDDGQEVGLGTDPNAVDTDGDGIQDGTEVASGTDPLDETSVPSNVYVDGASGNDATGLGTQSAPWATVAHAVDAVEGTPENTVSIHIAQGVYTHLNATGGALVLDSHEHLLGGYNATGWSRDVETFVTTLDASVANNGAPARQVVVLNSVSDVRLDGLTITGARSQGNTVPEGAGIVGINLGNSVIIAACRVQLNFSGSFGGAGIRLTNASPVIQDSFLVENITMGSGGGLFAQGNSAPVVERCRIGGNFAYGGGGVALFENAAITISNSVLTGNNGRTRSGGAMYLAGGQGTRVINSTIAYNDGEMYSAGGVYLERGSAAFVNTIFANNLYYALASWVPGNPLHIENCLFHDNPDGDYDGFQGVLTGAAAINANVPGATGNVDGDPLFQILPGTLTSEPVYNAATHRTVFTDSAANFVPGSLQGKMLAILPYETYQIPILDNSETEIFVMDDYTGYYEVGEGYRIIDYHLQPGSAAIDMGIDTSAPEDGGVTTDFDGVLRGFDGNGDGAVTADGSDYDIGAFESDVSLEPTLTVLSPNGGEAISRGTYVNITWESSGDLGANVKIAARRQGQAFNGTVVASTPNDGHFEWFVPASYPLASNFVIEISSIDDPAIVDTSDGTFTLNAGPAVGGTLTVLSPNGGEYALRGSVYPIQWSHTGYLGQAVKIVLRRGTSVFNIVGNTPNDGTFEWTVPNYGIASNYRIEISSVVAPAILDQSDGDFLLTDTPPPPPSITVASPNGGESFLPGAVVPIAWNSVGAAGSTVQILLHGGGDTATLAESTANDGAFEWTVPAEQAPGADYTVEVRSTSVPAAGDASDGPFTIVPVPSASITVIAPNGGEVVSRGTYVDIYWSTSGDVGAEVKISARRVGQAFNGTVAVSTPNDGHFQWYVPTSYPLAGNFVIEVSSVFNPVIVDTSDAPFTINAGPAVAGTLTVLSPNGGESVQRGGQAVIQWSHTGYIGGAVKIVLRRGTSVFTVSGNTPNDGSFEWSVPTYGVASNYRIEISSVVAPAIVDQSDGDFSFVN